MNVLEQDPNNVFRLVRKMMKELASNVGGRGLWKFTGTFFGEVRAKARKAHIEILCGDLMGSYGRSRCCR